MNWKKLSVASVAAILLLLFLPVFYHVIFYGNNMNYNSDHKIYAIYGNKVLLALTGVGILAFMAVIYLVRKIPFNRCTVTGFVLLALGVCAAFYFVNVEIAKCIAFYGGWDCGMVANSARWVYEGGEMGYGDYYTIYTNNVPITWLLYKLYDLGKEMGNYPYNPEFIWIQFQCFMHTAAVFCSAVTVLLVTQKVGFAALTLVVNGVLLGLSPWKIIPYTDASTIAIPIVVIFLYAMFVQMKSRWKYCVWLLWAFVGVLGGIMKATCYVPVIAILLIEVIWVLTGKEQIVSKLKKLILQLVLLGCGFLVASWCKTEMYQTLHFEYDYDMEIGWRSYLYMGLNEETTGACSPDAMSLVQEFAGQPRAVREAYELECVKERLEEKGLKGLFDFWLRKLVMTYNDGTFSWYQEGYFNAVSYEDITDSSWQEPLRAFYWEDGRDYQQFVTLSHGIWLFVLVGVIVEAVMVLLQTVISFHKGMEKLRTKESSPEMAISGAAMLTFVGILLFLMLFEGRARYLYNNVAVFATMTVMGYCKLVETTSSICTEVLHR